MRSVGFVVLLAALITSKPIAAQNGVYGLMAGPGVDGDWGGALTGHFLYDDGLDYSFSMGMRDTDEVSDDIDDIKNNRESYNNLNCANWHNDCEVIIDGKQGSELFSDMSLLTDFDGAIPYGVSAQFGAGVYIQDMGRVTKGVTEYRFIEDDVAYYVDEYYDTKFGLYPVIGIHSLVSERVSLAFLYHGRLGMSIHIGITGSLPFR